MHSCWWSKKAASFRCNENERLKGMLALRVKILADYSLFRHSKMLEFDLHIVLATSQKMH